MKFTHLGRLVMTLEAMQDLVANVQLHQAVATVLSPFIVIEARINGLDHTLEQVIYDPSGKRLPAVEEGAVIPKLKLNCGKSSTVSLYDNPYYASLQVLE